MQSSEVHLRVRYAETDQMGVVYHANYLVWMEIGRVELCRSAGVRYRDMEEQDGIMLTVVEASCRFIAPARYDDEIRVRTTVSRSTTRLLGFSYEILSADTGRILVTGSTTHIYAGRDLRPCRLPEKYWTAFQVTNKRQTALSA
ncbi:MAG: acyl-CoA thioesterase [Bryobacteraceae bacterium]|nr:acyl-CoA thioesterase [Bryobacteraceae bacterium]